MQGSRGSARELIACLCCLWRSWRWFWTAAAAEACLVAGVWPEAPPGRPVAAAAAARAAGLFLFMSALTQRRRRPCRQGRVDGPPPSPARAETADCAPPRDRRRCCRRRSTALCSVQTAELCRAVPWTGRALPVSLCVGRGVPMSWWAGAFTAGWTVSCV